MDVGYLLLSRPDCAIIVSGHIQPIDPPPLPANLTKIRGGSIAWGKLDFQKSYFLCELKQDLVPKGKLFAASRRICILKHSKKFSPLRGEFLILQ